MILAIIQHEFKNIIRNRRSWICLGLLQALLALIFNWNINSFLQNRATLIDARFGITEAVIHPYYAWFCLLVLFFIPMLATQTLCSEKANKTIVNYYCAPISATKVILGKFFAINLILIMVMLAISLLPLSVALNCSLDWGQICASLIGVYLLLSSALAVGLACSSFMQNISRSNILIFLVIISLILFEWAAQFTGPHAKLLQSFGLLVPLKNFLSGVLVISNVAYYLEIISTAIVIASLGYQRGAQRG